MSERLIAQMLAAREFTVELGGGRSVRLRRPAEVDMGRARGGLSIAFIVEHSVGWAGFDEAFLLGPTVGSTDAVPFDADLWRVALSDHVEWLAPIGQRVGQAMGDHLTAKAAAAKN